MENSKGRGSHTGRYLKEERQINIINSLSPPVNLTHHENMLKNSSNKSVVIVGAGVAGLTLGYLLRKQGWDVVVIEQNDAVGGLARSFRYGDFIFDIGPKRFHTDDKKVLEFIFEILEREYLTVSRSSSVYLFGRYFEWPLNLKALLKLPPKIMVQSFIDLLHKKNQTNPDSFSQYTQSSYGDTLYRLFFKPYTEKFLQISCEEVHADWAKTGINRSVIDNRIKSDSLLDLVRTVLIPKPVTTEFIYPSHDGFGLFCDKMAEKLRNLGGKILLSNTVSGIIKEDDLIKRIALTDGQKFEPDYLIWSGNLVGLSELMEKPRPKIRYLSTICYNLEVEGEPLQHAQWIYYSGVDLLMSRVSIMNEMASYMSPSNKTALCVEVTCLGKNNFWKNPESFIDRIKQDLVKVRLLKKGESVNRIHIERIGDTYPVYDLAYRNNFKEAASMAESYKNLLLLGRTGTFWYNNTDHSIKMSLDMARYLIYGEPMEGKDEYFKV